MARDFPESNPIEFREVAETEAAINDELSIDHSANTIDELSIDRSANTIDELSIDPSANAIDELTDVDLIEVDTIELGTPSVDPSATD